MENQQLATVNPFALTTWDDMDRMAKYVSESGMFGLTKPAQAMCLFAICQAEGINAIDALRQYHLIEGKPSMRADAMHAKFLAKGGGIIFHTRTETVCAATFFADKAKINDAAKKRAAERVKLLWTLLYKPDEDKSGKITLALFELAMDGEETVVRTYADCEAKGLTEKSGGGTKANWKSSPRQMLTSRVLTEGIRLIAPGLIAGIYTPEEVQEVAQVEKQEAVAALQPKIEADPIIKEMQEAMESHLAAADKWEAQAEQASDPDMKKLALDKADNERTLAAELQRKIDGPQEETVPITEAKPPKVIEGNFSVMPKEAPVSPARPSEPAPKGDTAESDAPPAGKVSKPAPKPAPKPPKEPDFREYKIQRMKGKVGEALNGQALVDLDREQIEVLAKSKAINKNLESADPGLKLEAQMIMKAWEAIK
jgi:hypothetical protein